MTGRISGLFGGRRCRDVGYGTPFGPPASDRCGEPCGDVGVCTTEDAKTNIEEEGEEKYGDEDNGELSWRGEGGLAQTLGMEQQL